MSRILILACITLFILANIGCGKQKVDLKASVNNSLQGIWELRITKGGYTAPGNNYHEYAPGNGNKWRFNLNSTFEFYQNGVLVSSGTYSTGKENNPALNGVVDYFIIASPGSNYDGWKQYFYFTNNRLVLFSAPVAADGVEEKYERIQGN